MLSTMIRKHARRIIVAGSLTVLLIVTFIANGYAAYRIQRPITDNGGVILQTYLWGEDGHRGVDFIYPRGTHVYAVASGTVVDYREDRPNDDKNTEWGNFVLIQHDQRHYDRTPPGQWAYVYSMYLHLSQNSVQFVVGDHVNAGNWIADVDHTGRLVGDFDHLHLQMVIHPDPNRTLEPIFTLDSENRSRNPELWLTPYNGNTGTVVGKVTDVNGNPVGGLYVYGLQKQAGWGYGSSQTYNNDVLKPDDILVENWGTTDVTPGTYTITLSNGYNFGRYDVQAGRITYVGLYPVWLPEVRNNNNNNGWIGTIIVRNNSSTFRAQVNTTFFNTDGTVKSQRTDYVSAKAIANLSVPANWLGSALVVSSEDVSVIVRDQYGDELDEYNGITAAAGSLGWERVGNTFYAPVIKNAYADRSSRLLIANAGSTATTAYVQFYDGSGYSVGAPVSVNLAPNGSGRVYPDNCTISLCSAKIWSSDSQPLAVAVVEQTVGTTNNRAMHNAFSAGSTRNFVPVVKNNYGGQTTGISVQNLSSQSASVSLTCYDSLSSSTYACGTQNNLPSMATAVFYMGAAGLPNPFLGSAVVNASQQVATTIHESGNPYKLCTNALLAGSTTAYAPELYGNYAQGGQTWNSGISIQNVGSASANVTVTYYDSGGNQVGSPVSSPLVGPNRTWTVNYWAGNLPGNFYGSAVIQANQPIAAVVNTSHTGSGDTKASYTASNR